MLQSESSSFSFYSSNSASSWSKRWLFFLIIVAGSKVPWRITELLLIDYKIYLWQLLTEAYQIWYVCCLYFDVKAA